MLSDDPGWWERAERRRRSCALDAPWLLLKQVGWPVQHAHTLVEGDQDWLQGARECAAYLCASGLVDHPEWVYGLGVRALWDDAPGRWSVVHAAVPSLVDKARAYQATAPAPREPRVEHALVTGLPLRLIRREQGEIQATIGDAIALAIAYGDVDPARCFGAHQRSVPTLYSEHDSTFMSLGDGGLAITTPPVRTQWAAEFARGAPYALPPGTTITAPAGEVTCARFGWRALAERARAGDRTVPASPLELGVCFLETVAVAPHDCWGIFEVGGMRAPERTFVQIVYRRTSSDAAGRERFAAYLAELGVTPGDLDVGHPEGKLTFSRATSASHGTASALRCRACAASRSRPSLPPPRSPAASRRLRRARARVPTCAAPR